MEEGIIVSPQITQLFEDKEVSTKLNSTEIRACKTFGKSLQELSRQ
jgi:hypothetical protein